MLVFSSRELEGYAAMSAVNQQLSPAAAQRLQAACQPLSQMQHMTTTPWQVVQMNCDVDDANSMNKLLPLFQQAQPLLVYLHGHHSTPVAFFERCDRLQSLYGLEIVRFSWSSKKHMLDDGFCPGLDAGANANADVGISIGAGVDDGLQQELQRLSGAQVDSMPPATYPPLHPVASELDNLTCSWWLLMALTGVRH